MRLPDVPVPKKQMIVFLMIDTSSSMEGAKASVVNDVIDHLLPILGEIADRNPDVEIKVAALGFSTRTRWLYDDPKLLNDFVWQGMKAEGSTSLGEACQELNKKLSHTDKGGSLTSRWGGIIPVLIFLSGSTPTDDFEGGLKVLQTNFWFNIAIKFAIPIGDDADKGILKNFTGKEESIITVHNIEALKKMIRVIHIEGHPEPSTSPMQEKVLKEAFPFDRDMQATLNQVSINPAVGYSYDEWD